MKNIIDYLDFEKVDIRVGKIIEVEDFPEARKPAIKVWVEFGGDIGIKQSSAQITAHYDPKSLVGKQIIGCLNLGSMRIAGFKSEFLVIGLTASDGSIILISPDAPVPNGEKLC